MINFSIKELNAFAVIGQEVELTNYQKKNIQISTQFWRKFNSSLKKAYLSQSGNWVKYAFMERRNGKLYYFCSIPQRTITPEGFLYKEIPSYKYLVVEHIGAMDKIDETYGKIYHTLKNTIIVFIGIVIIQLLKFGYLFKIRNNFISIHTKQLVLGLTAFSIQIFNDRQLSIMVVAFFDWRNLKMNDKNFIEELRQKREEYGVTQTRLAVACGISREYYNRIEKGKQPLNDELREVIEKQIERFNPQEPLFLLIDYFRVRFPTTDALAIIRDVLQLKSDYMLYEDYGKYGYESKYVFGDINIMCSMQEHLGVLLELKGKGCRQMECYLLAQERSWYDFMLDCMTAGGVMKRLDLAINDRAGILDIPKLKEKYKAGECVSYFRMQKDYSGTEKCGSDLPKNTGETLYLGSTSSELYMCAYQKNYEQYVKNGTEIEDTEINNRFEIRMKNERAYYAVVDLLTYRDAERTAFSIINHYVRFVDREDDKPKSQWKTNDDWAWFVGENREPIRLTTKPEPYTLQKALHWLQRQVAPTIKMVQALDKENHTTILKDMIEQAELKDKHKHLLQLEKSTIEERIDTAVPQENDGIF